MDPCTSDVDTGMELRLVLRVTDFEAARNMRLQTPDGTQLTLFTPSA